MIDITAKLVALYATYPQVVAIALSGSQASGTADVGSDIDLYVYTHGEFSAAEQQAVLELQLTTYLPSLHDYWIDWMSCS